MGTAARGPGLVLVLVIDDDAAILGMVRELLDGEGYAVATLRTPPADPADLAPLAPDLIVADLVYPDGTDGAELLRRFADHPATAAIPVVVCSADRLLLDRLGPDLAARSCAVVEKPFDIDDLLAAIAACLQNRDHDAEAG